MLVIYKSVFTLQIALCMRYTYVHYLIVAGSDCSYGSSLPYMESASQFPIGGKMSNYMYTCTCTCNYKPCLFLGTRPRTPSKKLQESMFSEFDHFTYKIQNNALQRS